MDPSDALKSGQGPLCLSTLLLFPAANFLKAMEKDADERSRNKKCQRELSEKLKREGNVFFYEGDYGKAAERYSQVGEDGRRNPIGMQPPLR